MEVTKFSIGMRVLVNYISDDEIELAKCDNPESYHTSRSITFIGCEGKVVSCSYNGSYNEMQYQVQFESGNCWYLEHELYNKLVETPLWKVLNG
jgi:hypothetical protein